MPEYNAQEWEAVPKQIKIPLQRKHQIDLWISCTEDVQVFGVPQEKEKAPVILRTGKEFRFRSPLVGFSALQIKSKVEFGMKLVHSPRQDGENISDEKPPVVTMPEPDNLVWKMRQIAEANARQGRMPVLEPDEATGFQSYEYEDDQELMFEEEEIEHKREQREKAKAAAKKKAQEALAQPPKTAPSEAPHTAKEEAENPPDGGPPPSQQHAAE